MEENFLRIIGISRKDPRDKFTETDPIVVIPWRRIFDEKIQLEKTREFGSCKDN